ncbi:hypothetical protein HPB47_006139 [Ixodes persulcatus]|uniref:Uncharacterized protein n=1 Tax=Ixodes persulcatus TaxID=34615 RepID=A0AC60PB21_IXOPE|nr:hypothetical protein HPB47_006139 [Ixodes persulcatus]
MSPIPDLILPWQKTTVTPATPISKRMTNAYRRRKLARRNEQSGGGDDEVRVYVVATFKDGVAATVVWHYENNIKRKTLQQCVLEAIGDMSASSSQ